ASFGNPMAAINIKNQLSELLIQRGFNDFRDAIGFAHRGVQ
ncbi:MAG: dihydroorotate dehydrogenase, partial [Actinobacteria bacterium]|nr:dihydroorotate dehydrogenase [Actinomycetota bacterium]